MLVVLLALSYTNLSAQNVGVGTTNPGEKLDVNGNINVTGTIKANGADGQPNDVLMKNNSGTLSWGSICDYKNFMQFGFAGATLQQFTIPAGVTKLAMEIWGGGGGGNISGGGGAGGYGMGVINVSPGTIVSILVGGAGQGFSPPNPATSGGNTIVSYNGQQFYVLGGNGANSSFPGNGGSLVTFMLGMMYVDYNGGSGLKNQVTYQQISSTEFAVNTKYGSGGLAHNQQRIGGEGGSSVVSTSTGFTLNEIFGGQAFGWGEGGGGGKSFGYPGAAGKVLLRW